MEGTSLALAQLQLSFLLGMSQGDRRR